MTPSQPARPARKTPAVRSRHQGRENDEFDAAAANREMATKLQRNRLRRRARSQGLELRHSAYGYSLIDAARRRIDDRNDLTLNEVAGHLDALAAS
jgi:hypothetical protein